MRRSNHNGDWEFAFGSARHGKGAVRFNLGARQAHHDRDIRRARTHFFDGNVSRNAATEGNFDGEVLNITPRNCQILPSLNKPLELRAYKSR